MTMVIRTPLSGKSWWLIPEPPGSASRTEHRFDPAWFEHDRPVNVLLGSAHPWVEIAHEDQSHLKHPIDPVAHDRKQAQFWYNPSSGQVRARVPARPSDQTTLDLYNLINNSHLTSLFDMTRETPPVFEPVPSRGRSRRR